MNSFKLFLKHNFDLYTGSSMRPTKRNYLILMLMIFLGVILPATLVNIQEHLAVFPSLHESITGSILETDTPHSFNLRGFALFPLIIWFICKPNKLAGILIALVCISALSLLLPNFGVLIGELIATDQSPTILQLIICAILLVMVLFVIVMLWYMSVIAKKDEFIKITSRTDMRFRLLIASLMLITFIFSLYK